MKLIHEFENIEIYADEHSSSALSPMPSSIKILYKRKGIPRMFSSFEDARDYSIEKEQEEIKNFNPVKRDMEGRRNKTYGT
jgi:hypothetical protein